MHKLLPLVFVIGALPLTSMATTSFESESASVQTHDDSEVVIVSTGKQCNFSFDKDIYASYYDFRVQEGAEELMRISHNGDFWLRGEPVSISASDRGLLIQYKNGLTAQSEFVVEVMEEALMMTTYALSTTFTEMFGKRHKIVRRIDNLTEQLAEDFAMVAYQHDDTYVVQGSQLDQFGEQLSNTLETEIESIVEDSMGSMIWLVTKAIFAGSGSFEQRMEQFGERMEVMGETLGATMETWGEKIEERSEAMCSELARLREIEGRLEESIPDFSDHRLLK